jgi:hypothetical protein
LWIVAALSVGVEFNLFDASLPIRSRLGVPSPRLQLDLAEFFDDNAAPPAHSRRNRP